MRPYLCWLAGAAAVAALAAEPLTLQQAEQLALQNHPRVAGARAEIEIARANADVAAARQRFQMNGISTASVAEHGTRQGVGGINAPDLFSRVGAGISFNQLLTDFGRTSLAIGGAREIVEARRSSATAAEAEIRLNARVAFYRALQAQAAHDAAGQVRKSRDVLLRQVKTLAGSELRSTLDVSFAEVRLSESDLLLVRTENDRQSALIALARAMGLERPADWRLEEPALVPPAESVDAAVAAAVRARPELAALQHQIAAARKQLDSDKRLRMPTVEAIGLGGVIPVGDPRLRARYGGVGVNMVVPIFEGSAFSARQRESAARLQVLEAQHRDAVLQISASVRAQYVAVEAAARNIEVSRTLLGHADRTLRLSETRYSNGLGTIAEYTQAQLDAASAQIAYAMARYEAGVQASRLEFELGKLQ